jgi:tRNA pseudouridine38-40 synthase
VVNFTAPRTMPLDRLHQALNGMLPPDIAVGFIDEVAPEFHARFDARKRLYQYHISYQKHPIGRQYAWYMRRQLDMNTLQQAANFLIGRKDFTSFCVAAYEKENRICEIFSCQWEAKQNGLVFHIKGNRFLRAMVRSIVGTMVEMARGVRPATDMPHILEAQNRQAAGESAPPHGLFLIQVIYDKDLPGG